MTTRVIKTLTAIEIANRSHIPFPHDHGNRRAPRGGVESLGSGGGRSRLGGNSRKRPPSPGALPGRQPGGARFTERRVAR